MVNLLKRQLAPVTDEAWAQIDKTALQTLKPNLTARSLVDFSGPHGWELGAVNLGRIEIAQQDTPEGIPWGVRQVQPLVEVRIPFVMAQAELDNASRGAHDLNLDPLEEAARKIAHFEESAVYLGFERGQIRGLIPSLRLPAVQTRMGGEAYPRAVTDAVETLMGAGVDGPYALVLGPKPFHDLMEVVSSGYPPYRIIRELLKGGAIHWSPALEGGLVLSTRGGDFELTVGQDISIGYASHDRSHVELYLTESFTFRVLENQAAIELKFEQ